MASVIDPNIATYLHTMIALHNYGNSTRKALQPFKKLRDSVTRTSFRERTSKKHNQHFETIRRIMWEGHSCAATLGHNKNTNRSPHQSAPPTLEDFSTGFPAIIGFLRNKNHPLPNQAKHWQRVRHHRKSWSFANRWEATCDAIGCCMVTRKEP